MSNIYQLEQEYLDIARQLTDGELTPELETALAINKESLEIKAVKYGYVKKSIEDDVVSIEKEIARLTALKQVKENAIEKIKETVSTAMKLYGITEIKMQNLTVNFRPSTSVEIDDEKAIPKAFKVKKTTETISKKLIGDALKAGKKVKGAYLKENKNIQFK